MKQPFDDIDSFAEDVLEWMRGSQCENNPIVRYLAFVYAPENIRLIMGIDLAILVVILLYVYYNVNKENL